jgi:hypothetical protein
VHFGLVTLHDLVGVTAEAKHKHEYHVTLLLQKASSMAWRMVKCTSETRPGIACDREPKMAGSLDHLMGLEAEERGKSDPECLGGLQVEDELVVHRVLDREVRRGGAFQDLID